MIQSNRESNSRHAWTIIDSPATLTAILDERRPLGVERTRPALTPALFFCHRIRRASRADVALATVAQRALPVPSERQSPSMPAPRPPAFETLSLHAGQRPDPVTGARAVPIYQTTSYVFQDPTTPPRCSISSAPATSTRASPTRRRRCWRSASPRSRAASARSATASGMAALHLAIATLLERRRPHRRLGLALWRHASICWRTRCRASASRRRFVKPRDLDAFARRDQPETRLVIGETIGNPGLEVLDIPTVADIAHDAGVAAADRQHLRHALSLPADRARRRHRHAFRHQVDRRPRHRDRRRRWSTAAGSTGAPPGKFPTLTEPYAGYHGIVFAEEFGPAAFIMRARAEGLRDFGACLSPHQRLPPAAGRRDARRAHGAPHARTRRRCWTSLQPNKAVAWVQPSRRCASHPDHALAKRLLPRGAGSIVSFGIKGGRAGGRKFIEALRLVSHLANVGDAKTLVIHPASTTHQQMSAEQLEGRRRRRGPGAAVGRPRGGRRTSSTISARRLRASQRG